MEGDRTQVHRLFTVDAVTEAQQLCFLLWQLPKHPLEIATKQFTLRAIIRSGGTTADALQQAGTLDKA